MVPSGWEVKKLEDLCAPDAPITYGVLKPGEYCSNGIPLLQIKDLSDGQVSSKDLHLISKELDEEYKRSRILKNDILISLVGTIGRVAKFELSIPANIHRNLGRVRTDYHEFIFHFLNSDVALKLMGDSSSGSSQSALNLSTLRAMKVPFPPVKEQQKISKILSTWDQAISATEKLLENSQKQKNALMQQLLTGKKRLLDESGVRFSEEWQRIELGLLLDYQQPTPYLVESTAYSDSYKTPVLTAGKTFILGYTNESSGIYQDQLPVIIFDDFTTDSKYVNFPFKAKSSAMKILTAKKGVSIKFVFEAMQMLQFNVGGHQRHWISIFSNLVIPLPNLKEQQKIAEILSLADQEIETLQKKLNCLK
ncbi:restriction endonuclease subunit S [Acinetobacter sp. YH12157]|nr:restriction endonuclease subunit S [Acinetobacter sp. YH12157]